MGLIDAADNFAVRKHVVIVIAPMTRGARGSTLVSETLLLFLSLRAGPNRRKIFFREYPATAARRNYDMISTAPFP